MCSSLFLNAQTHQATYQTLVNQVHLDTITRKLQQFEALGIKEMGTAAQDNTRKWIIRHYERLGYTDIQEQEVTVGQKKGTNIIVTKKGKVHPTKFIVVGAHYDTLNGPGVNDNGTGTVTLLEMAKVFAHLDTEYAMKFIHFTAEEVGLIGSQHYVREIAVPQNLDIHLMLNIDEVGGVKGKVNNRIVCERDESDPKHNNQASSEITQQMASIIPMYTTLETDIGRAYSSDYMPFQAAGYTITGLFEQHYSSVPHTPNDLLKNMDIPYFQQVVKGAIATVLHFTNAEQKLATTEQDEAGLTIYPNPVHDQIFIKTNQATSKPKAYKILNLEGQVIKSANKSDFEPINVSYLSKGHFILSLYFPEKTFNYPFIKK